MTQSRIKLYEMDLQREIDLDSAEAIFRESPPSLREKVEWIRDRVHHEWRSSILIRYQIACVIREIYDDVNDHNGSVYGANAVVAIKNVLGWDDSVIYQALNVADAFTPEQIEAITQMRLPGGTPV